MNWAVFLDRDGTLNEEVNYLRNVDDLQVIPGAAEAVRLLNEAGVLAILVTNQAGIGRGDFSQATVLEIHQELARRLEASGAYLDAIYCCPHRPDEGCACRKPNPGMLLQAAREHGIDLELSVLVGDKASDLEAGRRAGCRTILVLTGYGMETREELNHAGEQPDHVAGNVLGAVNWLLPQPGAVQDHREETTG